VKIKVDPVNSLSFQPPRFSSVGWSTGILRRPRLLRESVTLIYSLIDLFTCFSAPFVSHFSLADAREQVAVMTGAAVGGRKRGKSVQSCCSLFDVVGTTSIGPHYCRCLIGFSFIGEKFGPDFLLASLTGR